MLERIERTTMDEKVTVIGPAIIDVLAGPIGDSLLKTGTMAMDNIKLTFGGNAFNEAKVLFSLGIPVDLITKIGNDEAGHRILKRMTEIGIGTEHVICQDGLSTSINIVLFDKNGERRFLTNPKGSQRCLSEEDIVGALDTCSNIICFTCMFISPLLDIDAMTRIFAKIKEKPERTLVVDMTKAKNGEKIEDLKPLLKYVDYILPNHEEIRILSNWQTDKACAEELLDSGVGCVVIKKGYAGCNVYTKEKEYQVGAFETKNVIDTTGAGDCFAAGFLYGLYYKKDIKECLKMANATASCCVEYVGATEGIISDK